MAGNNLPFNYRTFTKQKNKQNRLKKIKKNTFKYNIYIENICTYI